MVKIAIAGGAGNVAQEIIDVLVAENKHEILIMTRQDVPTLETENGIKWAKTEYADVGQLVNILQGVHTVLSFISTHLDQEGAANIQKRLIDASVQVGVKRFAPSEWVSSNYEHLSWYAYKATTRQYLEELNKDKKVLEYCLFQPGLFTNYLTSPYRSTKHITPFSTPFDFNNRRALVAKGFQNDRITLTTAEDLAHVVARAIDYEGEWPTIGGIAGTTLTFAELIALGEKVRGGKFDVTELDVEDLKNGTWTSPWLPTVEHPTILPEHREEASRAMVPSLLLAFKTGGFEVGDEWNRLLPDYEFTGAEEFVEREWRGKP